MQPCVVCGGTGVDAAGYCVDCRTYRGPSGQFPQLGGYRSAGGSPYPGRTGGSPALGGAPSPTGGTPDYSTGETPYATRPTSGSPYGSRPTSGSPYGDRPTSGSPYGDSPYGTRPAGGPPQGRRADSPYPPGSARSPSPAAPYPSGYAQSPAPSGLASILAHHSEPPRRRRRSLTLPVIGLSATLIVLVVVVVMVMRGGGQGSKSGLVDSCVVGSWTIASMKMDLQTESFGLVHFTSVGDVGQVRYDAKGHAVQEYGNGAEFSADVSDSAGNHNKVSLKIKGTARYDFRTDDSTMTYLNIRTEGSTTLTAVATGATSTAELQFSNEPAKYVCSDGTLTTYTEDYRSEARRTGG